MIILFRYYW